MVMATHKHNPHRAIAITWTGAIHFTADFKADLFPHTKPKTSKKTKH